MSDRYNNKIAKFVGWLNNSNRGYAVTITKNCTLYSSPLEQVGTIWRKHEDYHKLQIATLGWFKFMTTYFYYNLTKGYTNNPFEVAAREASLK